MRRRNMFNLTGQPGWMRLGCSPGWVGRSSSGLGPCAQFLLSGQTPVEGVPQQRGGFGWPAFNPGDRVDFLKSQLIALEQRVADIKAEIAELEGAEKP